MGDAAQRDLDWLDWLLAGAPDAIALDGPAGAPLDYAALRAAAARVAAALPAEVDAIAVACACPRAYALTALAALDLGRPAVLCAPGRPPPAGLGTLAVVTGADDTGTVEVAVDAGVGTAPDPQLARTALAIATSGSTGGSRLVALTAEGVRANISGILGYLPIDGTRTAITLPLWHAYAMVGQLLAGLRAGATLVFPSAVGHPAELARELARRGVHGLSSVAAQLAALARATDGAWRPRYLASAGGPLPRPVASRIAAAFPDAVLYDQYGLTEASPRVAAISSRDPAFATGSVGRPLPGVSVWAEHEGRRCRTGETGALWVSGPSLMLGYLGDPEATRERLRGGALRTGDRGYVDAGGYLHVLGRMDDLVNVAGERFSLAEVATVLRECEGITDVFVHAVAEGARGAALIAVVETEDDRPSVAERVRARARAALRAAQRPSHIVAVDALPRLANGKPDRRALAALAEAEARGRRRLRDLLASHVELPDDDAAPLDLDSLALVMLVEELENAYGVEVTAADIAAGALASVAAIARLVAARASR